MTARPAAVAFLVSAHAALAALYVDAGAAVRSEHSVATA
jgi:hypothetical protein